MYVKTQNEQKTVEFSAQTAFAAEERIVLVNSGTVCADWFFSAAQEIKENAFLVGKVQGKLMPQSETEIPVFFLPSRQGVFVQKWKLRTIPPSAAGPQGLAVTLVGVASHEDAEIDKKKVELKKTMKHKQITVQTTELVDDIMTSIKTPPATPPGEFDAFWLKYHNRSVTDTVPDVVTAFRLLNDKVNDWRSKNDSRFQPQSPYTIESLASTITSVKSTEPLVEAERAAFLKDFKALVKRLKKKRNPDTEIVFHEFLTTALTALSSVRASVLQARFGPSVPLDPPRQILEQFAADALKKQKNSKPADVLEQCRSEIANQLATHILDAVDKAVDVASQVRSMLAIQNRMDLTSSISRVKNSQTFPGDEPLSNHVVLYELPEGPLDSSTLPEILDKTPNALILLPPLKDSLPQTTARAMIQSLEKLIDGESVTEISDPASFNTAEITGEIGKRVFLATAKIRAFPRIATLAIVETFRRAELNTVRSVLVGPEISAEISGLEVSLEMKPPDVAQASFATRSSGDLLVFDGFAKKSRSLNVLRNLVPNVTSLVYLGGPLGLAAIKAIVNPKKDLATATVLVDLLGEFADIYVPTNFRANDELITLEMAVNAEKVKSQIFPGVWIILEAMAGKLEIANGEGQATQITGSRLDEVTAVAGSQEVARVKTFLSSVRKVVWLGDQSDDVFDAELATALSKQMNSSDERDDELPDDDGLQDIDEFNQSEAGSPPNRNVFDQIGSVPLEACAVVGARKRAAMEVACKDGFGPIYVSKNHEIVEAVIAGESIPLLDDIWN